MKLKELREEKILTIGELADKAGLHYNTVFRLENELGGARPSTIRKLAAALGVNPRELRACANREPHVHL